MKHGSYSTYSNHKCRCADCKLAWNAYMRSYYALRQAAMPKPPPPHGTESRYTHGGCRCGLCGAASTWARAERRAKQGTAR